LEKEADKNVIKIIEKELSHSRIGIIYKNKETKNLEAAT
jgi:hypothetical protein